MQLIDKVRARIREESFRPGWLGLLFNPAHIIRGRLWKAISKSAPYVKGNVLDFGCGSKPYEHLFTAASSYVGVDIEISGHQHQESKIDFFYDGKSLPFQDGQFDAVVSFEVFEHVFNITEILSEIWRVTRESGLLLISVPFAWQEHEVPYDFARYTSYAVSHLLRANGYEVLSLTKTTTSVLAICQLFIAYLESIAPRNRFGWYLFLLFVSFPCTVMAYTLNAVLPKRHEIFSNEVVLARKQQRTEGVESSQSLR